MDKRSALDSLRREASPDAARPSGRVGWRLAAAAGGLTLAVLAATGWWLLRPLPVAVHTATVSMEGGAKAGSVLNASGYVVAQSQATVAAPVTGMVTEVYVHEGDRVEKGQIVARLDDRAARANAAAAAGQLRTAQGQLAATEALVARYASETKRQRALAAAGATSQASLEAAEASLNENRGLAASYRGAVEQHRNTLAYYRTLLAYTEIRAPFSGVVTGRYAHPGEMISPQAVGGFTQTGICTIVDMETLEVDVDVGEAFITRLHAGQRAEIALDAYPDWRIPARVITIVPTANLQKATVKVRLAFDRLDPRILPQMSAQVWFEAESAGAHIPASLYMPEAALRRDAGGPFVFRIESEVARRAAVRTTPAGKARLRIVSGLHVGDRIVTSSEKPLSDGDKVREQ